MIRKQFICYVVTFSLLTAVFLLLCPTSTAQVAKLYPVDEAAKDPSFFTFRARLFRAIQDRDVAYVTSILHPKIQNSFGGDGGIAEFKETWKPQRPNSQLWHELGTCLALGGKFEGDRSFSAPYVFSSFPEKFDPFEYSAIVGENVRVRRAAATNSPVIKMLSFDIVSVPMGEKSVGAGKSHWILITLADGQRGFVSEAYIRSPIEYRAVFEKENGNWLMTAFIAGD